MKAAIYARVSTDRQEAENQVRELERVAANKGWPVAGRYVDDAVRGDAPKPALERLLQDAHRGDVDLVLFWSLDRLTRAGALDALQLLDRFERQGIAYWSYREPYLDSSAPFHSALTAFIAEIASFEKRRLSERVKAGMARARAGGKHIGRPFADTRGLTGSEIAAFRAQGLSWAEMEKRTGVSSGTLRRLATKAGGGEG